ncbi:DUF1904 family protein [Paenibacillus sp. LMG 31456]|uniref:DUF1904 family protein n=1 Tax=Paenibacillus foliorum TaxID=2654974 RepID=A0A972H5V6_9BACL|nr:DUF1904 family protein [Paenibacillus foliorum]NOU96916.1 DUF1904 family protein [Paenibacillus foliorum]
MPQLNVRGISADQMSVISKPMIEELAWICECGSDNFTIDCMQTVSVFDGQRVDTYPFVEIAWFERGTTIRDRVALAVTQHIQSIGVKEVEVAFKVYSEDGYYINGRRCDSL